MSQLTFAISGPVLRSSGLVEAATVFMSQGRIEEIHAGIDPGADLHAEGMVIPGLIDLQVNGAYGQDFTNDASAVLDVAERLPATGVTAFMPTVITSPFADYPRRIEEIAQAMRQTRSGARILGVHLEGPYLNPKRKGAHPADCLRRVDVEEIRAWAADKAVRIVTLAPELPGALDAVRALRSMGKVVSAGHSDATFDQARAGFDAGINWATHLYNAQSALGHREPGMIGAILLSDVPCGLIVDGIHSHPAMVALAWKAKGTGGIVLVTDCMAAMGMDPGRYELGQYTVIVDETSARLEDGTLAGSILTMEEAVRNMAVFSGCTLLEAIRMATVNPAHLLGLTGLGMIAPGCSADLVVLSPEQQITHTFVAGELAYQRE